MSRYHDWGAPVAWHTALLRPDLVRGVAGLSVPPPLRGPHPPLASMQERFDGRFHWNHFARPGVADAEIAKDTRTALRKFFYSASGDAPRADGGRLPLVDPEPGWLADMPDPEVLPDWFTEDDLDALTESFSQGFTGALNWYRNLDRNWELAAPWHGAVVTTPALYMYGDRDLVPAFPGTPEFIERLPALMPNLWRAPVELPGCGHGTQQERPAEVNAALVEFLRLFLTSARGSAAAARSGGLVPSAARWWRPPCCRNRNIPCRDVGCLATLAVCRRWETR